MQHLTAAWQRLAMPMDPPDDLDFVLLSGVTFGRPPTMVAISGKEAIGVLGYMATSMYGPPETDMLYVAPAWRRKGIATLLFEALKKEVPNLVLSGDRTDMAEAWVKSPRMSTNPAEDHYGGLPAYEAEHVGDKLLQSIQHEIDAMQPAH